jgi:hypothetical protein
MSLTIAAYSNIKIIEGASSNKDGICVNHDGENLHDFFHPYINTDYPKHAVEIQKDSIYGYEKILIFPAGSYRGYNIWRNCLAHFAGYESAKSVWGRPWLIGPFVELIDFSDCEGVIGSSLSAKLAKDFTDFNDRAKKTAAEYGGDWFYSLYQKWQQAYELAAQNGAISFH